MQIRDIGDTEIALLIVSPVGAGVEMNLSDWARTLHALLPGTSLQNAFRLATRLQEEAELTVWVGKSSKARHIAQHLGNLGISARTEPYEETARTHELIHVHALSLKPAALSLQARRLLVKTWFESLEHRLSPTYLSPVLQRMLVLTFWLWLTIASGVQLGSYFALQSFPRLELIGSLLIAACLAVIIELVVCASDWLGRLALAGREKKPGAKRSVVLNVSAGDVETACRQLFTDGRRFQRVRADTNCLQAETVRSNPRLTDRLVVTIEERGPDSCVVHVSSAAASSGAGAQPVTRHARNVRELLLSLMNRLPE